MSNNGMLTRTTAAAGQHLATGTERLSIADVIVKTAACLAVVIMVAVPGWIFLAGSFILYLGILVVTMIVGVLIARRAPIPAAFALGYSALLGLVVGAFSHAAVAYGGYIALIPQAVLGTVAGTVGMLAVYATPFGKKASKAVKLFFGIFIGYFLVGVLSAIAAIFFGTGSGWGFYGVGGLGLLLCVFGVAMACWSLLIDIGQTDRALQSGVGDEYGWTFGVSLAASLVWIYLEILRLLAISGR